MLWKTVSPNVWVKHRAAWWLTVCNDNYTTLLQSSPKTCRFDLDNSNVWSLIFPECSAVAYKRPRSRVPYVSCTDAPSRSPHGPPMESNESGQPRQAITATELNHNLHNHQQPTAEERASQPAVEGKDEETTKIPNSHVNKVSTGRYTRGLCSRYSALGKRAHRLRHHARNVNQRGGTQVRGSSTTV